MGWAGLFAHSVGARGLRAPRQAPRLKFSAPGSFSGPCGAPPVPAEKSTAALLAAHRKSLWKMGFWGAGGMEGQAPRAAPWLPALTGSNCIA